MFCTSECGPSIGGRVKGHRGLMLPRLRLTTNECRGQRTRLFPLTVAQTHSCTRSGASEDYTAYEEHARSCFLWGLPPIQTASSWSLLIRGGADGLCTGGNEYFNSGTGLPDAGPLWIFYVHRLDCDYSFFSSSYATTSVSFDWESAAGNKVIRENNS